MDILYVLGTGSKWDNNELRYSLRSIEKFGRNVDNVFVVGANPGFLSDKVTYIECPDVWSPADKHKNMLYKVVYAVLSSNIAEEFLISSDDHFYVKETDFNNYPYYYKGELPDSLEGDICYAVYKKSLYDTRKLLEEYGLPYYHFGHHGNVHCSRKAIYSAKEIITYSFTTAFGCEPYCIILNKLLAEYPFEIVKRQDKKVYDELDTKEKLEEYIGNSEVFSIDDSSIELVAKDYLAELFSDKSIYEK